MALSTLISPDVKIKVSSTLDKSVGKKFLIDGSPETCWTSQQGLPQYIQLSFPSPVVPKRIALTFQGGFVGKRCSVFVLPPDTADWHLIDKIFPEDVNRKQVFDLAAPAHADTGAAQQLKLVFEESSDFFGRITIYDLAVDGALIA